MKTKSKIKHIVITLGTALLLLVGLFLLIGKNQQIQFGYHLRSKK